MAFSPKVLRRNALREMLIQARKGARLSQAQVAAQVGKPQAFVSRYETGERQLEVAELIEISEALGVDPGALVKQLAKLAAKPRG